MSKSHDKFITICIKFKDSKNLKYVLSEIPHQVQYGYKFYRVQINDALIEWSLDSLNEQDYEEKIIDNKIHHIYKSKM